MSSSKSSYRRSGKLDDIYYIFNEGARGSCIFNDRDDYLRFIYNLFVFGKKTKKGGVGYGFLKYLENKRDIYFREEYIVEEKSKDKTFSFPIIIAFSLLPHSFHLMLRVSNFEKIYSFIKNVCISYALYFNKKYKQKGTVFAGRYKCKQIKTFQELKEILFYIHYLPYQYKKDAQLLSGNINKENETVEFLKTYQWSSHLEYCGWNNFPQLVNTDILWGMFNGPEAYKQMFLNWININEEKHNKIEEA